MNFLQSDKKYQFQTEKNGQKKYLGAIQGLEQGNQSVGEVWKWIDYKFQFSFSYLRLHKPKGSTIRIYDIMFFLVRNALNLAFFIS